MQTVHVPLHEATVSETQTRTPDISGCLYFTRYDGKPPRLSSYSVSGARPFRLVSVGFEAVVFSHQRLIQRLSSSSPRRSLACRPPVCRT